MKQLSDRTTLIITIPLIIILGFVMLFAFQYFFPGGSRRDFLIISLIILGIMVLAIDLFFRFRKKT